MECGDLVVYVREPPIHGRANAALKRVLARKLGIRTDKIEIVYGVRSCAKEVLIRGMRAEELKAKLLG